MTVTTPLGADKLLLRGFEGTEQLSGLFSFRLDLVATNSTKVAFDQLLGQELVVTMQIENEDPQSSEAKVRYFRGICRSFEQGNRDQEFTSFRAEIVPQFWFTTRTAQSRIFQQMSVPEILKKVLAGLKVDYQLDGAFEKREYCVQYRETDFNFACRLMEEEGMFYFFKHTKEAHEMVVGNSARVHPDVDGVTKVQWNVEGAAPGTAAHSRMGQAAGGAHGEVCDVGSFLSAPGRQFRVQEEHAGERGGGESHTPIERGRRRQI